LGILNQAKSKKVRRLMWTKKRQRMVEIASVVKVSQHEEAALAKSFH
jgi:hypothetical protein